MGERGRLLVAEVLRDAHERVRGEHLVLGEHAVNGRAESGLLGLRGDLPEDVVRREVGRDATADGLLRDVRAEREDLAREVGVVLPPQLGGPWIRGGRMAVRPCHEDPSVTQRSNCEAAVGPGPRRVFSVVTTYAHNKSSRSTYPF